ncbi:hypothetical protein BGZ83_007364 [Gryganskiella cystojenkinii]|nr:hypothetical protein BGZ83_007364 [Gryganskiella cystojenkinii]
MGKCPGKQDIVTTLLQQSDYIPSEYGLNKAFEVAYQHSHHDTVKALLSYAEKRGAQLEQGTSSFQSVVSLTRRSNRVLVGGLQVQKDEDRALRYAVLGNDLQMVRLLMEYGANVHAFQENPVLVAAQKGHIEILKVLIQAGADTEVLAGAPLRYAAEQGQEDVVRILCESGADTMWGGCSALRTAASKGHDRIMAVLLDYGANVNIHEGTPLQVACQHGHEAAVRVLLRYGANHRLDDGAAYKFALEANNESIKALLIQAETKMRAKEHELERIYRQQGAYMMAPSSHTRTMSEASVPTFAQQQPHRSFGSYQGSSLSGTGSGSTASSVPGAQGTCLSGEVVTRGHKRFYSQMSNALTVADLFRSGSVCGLVALDDEIRSRQRSEGNRL